MFHQKSPRERACCHDEAANLQLLISAAFWVIWVSMEEWSWNVNGKSEADSLFYSIILNVTATQYTCSLDDIYHPHWLVQWSCHCSHMHIPVHSPWLPGSIDVVQTILIILTMAQPFLDRPHISIPSMMLLGMNYSYSLNPSICGIDPIPCHSSFQDSPALFLVSLLFPLSVVSFISTHTILYISPS